MAALIGISSFRTEVTTEDQPVHHVATQVTYVRAVAKTGAVPVLLPEADPDEVDAYLDRLDGIVLVGGPDIDPSRYGQERDPLTLPASAERDAFDLALACRCVERNHPLLAICRGNQILNVALGGTLVQHVEDHSHVARYNQDVHTVDLDPTSRLAGILGGTQVGTNSLHHQAVDQPGNGIRIVGHAPDGVVEALEVDDAPNVIGVQWHPELLRHRPEHLALFASLARLAV